MMLGEWLIGIIKLSLKNKVLANLGPNKSNKTWETKKNHYLLKVELNIYVYVWIAALT